MDFVFRMYLLLSDVLEINVIDFRRILVKDLECDFYKLIVIVI